MRQLTVGIILLIVTTATAAADTALSDPMQPAVTPPKSATDSAAPAAAPVVYTLSAIKIEALHRSAIINNQLVRVGAEVDGAHVLKISPQVVDIRAGETHLALRLNKHDYKHRATATQRR